jgi:hypothetical protein
VELNILLRGQSNAQLMGEYNGGAQAMAAKVESLLGFDGVTDRVSLDFSSRSDTANTVFSGTSFLSQWLNAKDGDWQKGWTVDELEQSLLTYVGNLTAAQKAEPTAVVWLHSEYDSGNASLSPAEFESAVRFDAALVRAAYGQPAASLPYLFVSAIPYSEGSDAGHQAIRAAMEEMAVDPAFNARIAARALDTDMNFQDVTGDGVNDYGGPHQSNEDGVQTGERIAASLAQSWAQYAKPGSPVALQNGLVDDLGPQVIGATAVGAGQLAVKVGFDAANSLAALDATAAAGAGWMVVGSDGVAHAATGATLTGVDTLLLSFGTALPTGSTLFYGYGYGRLEAADGTGRGHAVYDDQGMPLWVQATGLAVGGVAASVVPLVAPAVTPVVAPVAAPAAAAPVAAVAPVGGGTALPPAQFGSAADGWSQAGQVWAGTLTYAEAPYQTFGGRADWGSLAGVQFAPASWDPSWSTHLAFDNLPQAVLDLQAAGAAPLDVLLVSARGGSVVLGNGSDHFTWVAHTDTAGDGNVLRIQANGGGDVIHLTAAGLSGLADHDRVGNGSRYDAAYDGHNSTAEIYLGSGADRVTTEGAVSLVTHGGAGVATVQGGSQRDAFMMASGGGTYTGGAGADHWLFVPGAGSTTITDFTTGEDWLTFAGILPGQLGIQAVTQGGVAGLAITFDAAGDSVFLAGVAALGAGDVVFA